MESHENDPTTGPDAWQHVGERWESVREELKTRYREVAGEDGPNEDQIREALATLGGAARHLIASIGDTARDPSVRTRLKEVTASLVTAIGSTFEDLGEELRRTDEEE